MSTTIINNLSMSTIQSSPKVESGVVSVSPALAAEWLKSGIENRPIRKSHVAFLADQMRSGQWVLNGAPIIFVGREMVDGQHRLNAVIRSGRTVSMLVVRMPNTSSGRRVFETIDQNVPRSYGDVLAIKGESNYKTLGTLLRMITVYKAILAGSSRNNLDFGRQRIPNSEILVILDECPQARRSASFAEAVKTGKNLLSRSQWALLHYALHEVDESDAELFLDGLRFGANLSPGSPILVLRNKLIEASSANAMHFTKRYGTYQALFISCKAWNAFRLGKSISHLKYSDKESFPCPR